MSEPRPEAENDVDDAFRALLEGLRTTLPGVQVLFGFLLILPFESVFDDLGGPEKTAYYVSFFASAAASIILISPSAHQRVRALFSGVRRHSPHHLQVTVRMTIVGTVLLAIALIAAVYLISAMLLDSRAAVGATIVITGLLAWAWFYVPLVTFRDDDD